jgi:hypothetical protein
MVIFVFEDEGTLITISESEPASEILSAPRPGAVDVIGMIALSAVSVSKLAISSVSEAKSWRLVSREMRPLLSVHLNGAALTDKILCRTKRPTRTGLDIDRASMNMLKER